MLIQNLVRHDSIIASQRLVVEFCNTIPREPDMTGAPGDVAEVPNSEIGRHRVIRTINSHRYRFAPPMRHQRPNDV